MTRAEFSLMKNYVQRRLKVILYPNTYYLVEFSGELPGAAYNSNKPVRKYLKALETLSSHACCSSLPNQ